MKHIRLGKTELKVSEVGFGGIPMIPLSLEDSVELVRYCYERGITFFDTANMYGDSENKIGAALESVRDKVVYATKTTMRDAEGTTKHIEFSLNNLKTDAIDLYQFHNISTEENLEKTLAPGGAMEAVKKAMDQGKIRFMGFSSHNIDIALKACRTGLFSTIQFPFNFIENDPLDELFKVAEDLDMGIIAMKPLGGGLLEKAALCFGFLQQYPHIVPIPGIKTKEEIDEIIQLYESPQVLGPDEKNEMERIRSELGKDFCHRCGYCLPCDQDVKITDIFGFSSMAKRLAPSIALMVAKSAMETVDNCTECEECIEKCPYNLRIPELIKETRERYETLVSKSA
ncbi:MAG: aldo/keto reductase [Proteobacteria bacterium]|nr:aldo/keto reductase [Pseudomonadota bacterium]